MVVQRRGRRPDSAGASGKLARTLLRLNLNYKPTDPPTKSLYLSPGASGQGSPWRPLAASLGGVGSSAASWAPGQAQKAGPAPGAQGQRPVGEPRGVARALPAARSQWSCAPPRSGPGKPSRSSAPQAARTPHRRAPRSLSHSSRGPLAGPGRPGARPPKAPAASGRGARPADRLRGGQTDRKTDGRIR